MEVAASSVISPSLSAQLYKPRWTISSARLGLPFTLKLPDAGIHDAPITQPKMSQLALCA